MQNYCTQWATPNGETVFKISSKAKTLRQKVQHAVNIVTSWDNWIGDEEFHIRLSQYKEKWMFSEEEYKHIITLSIKSIKYMLHLREAIEILLSEWAINEWQFEKIQREFTEDIKK